MHTAGTSDIILTHRMNCPTYYLHFDPQISLSIIKKTSPNCVWMLVWRWPNDNAEADLIGLACSMRSGGPGRSSRPGCCRRGGFGRCSLLCSTESVTQTLHVEAHCFLCCRCCLQDVDQHLTEFLVGVTQNISKSSKNNYVRVKIVIVIYFVFNW